ncbi:MAG: hypothetical protein IT242_07755 [Bacteroidia bacterium]|nr:hypothetical protein [Bacteroidia bacterium]
MAKNQVRQPMVITFSALMLFVALSFVPSEWTIGEYTTKKIDLFSEVRFERKLPDVPFPQPVFTQRMKDSLGVLIRLRDRLSVVNYSTERFGAMAKFYEALMALENGEGSSLRIGYFGDSMIEGDLLTMDLRSSFQKQFGGHGVGFVSITSIVAGFRNTIRHSFSPDWIAYHFNNSGGTMHPPGPSGYSYLAQAGSSVTYKASPYMGTFHGIKFYYGPGDGSGKMTSQINSQEITHELTGSEPVNELVLNTVGPVPSITSKFSIPPMQHIYGFSFEGGRGVYLDNYSFRGNSGLALTAVPQNVFRGFNTYMNYKLIVLHYGLNVVAHNIGDYSWYEKGLRNMIDHVKASFPEASILLVSVNDKSYRGANGWETEPDVPLLVESQRKVAEEKGVAFWNLYESMGGYNSMVRWVEGDTVFANKDYTHPNAKGAKKIADMFYAKLMEQYALYRKFQGKE